MSENKGKSFLDEKSIADSRDDEQVLKGVQPKHQKCYKFYKVCKFLAIFGLIFTALAVIAAIVAPHTGNVMFIKLTANKIYRTYILLGLGGISLSILLVGLLDKAIFLKKAPFDDWVFEIAEKRLGTSIIFYDSKYIYINYDRGGKEVDKKEFVTEMSDKSIHYSYYYIKTFIDQGVIMVECKKRQPIPNRASFSAKDDPFWNIVPMGLTINPNTQKVSPIGWYLNDQNKSEELYPTVPSTSILICGGTGCLGEDEPVLMENTLVA